MCDLSQQLLTPGGWLSSSKSKTQLYLLDLDIYEWPKSPGPSSQLASEWLPWHLHPSRSWGSSFWPSCCFHSKSTHFFSSNARWGSICHVNNLLTVLFSALLGYFRSSFASAQAGKVKRKLGSPRTDSTTMCPQFFFCWLLFRFGPLRL